MLTGILPAHARTFIESLGSHKVASDDFERWASAEEDIAYMGNERRGHVVNRDFSPDNWHDHAVWGLRWLTGDGEDDWTSEFEILFDSILNVRRIDDVAHYRVAPAKLVFADVADLRISIDNWAPRPVGALLQTPMIHTVERTAHQGRGDAPYFGWRIAFEMPPKGEISFGASCFVETVLAEATQLVDRWALTDDERTRLLGASGQQF